MSVRAGPSFNLELVPPPPHPTTPAFVRHRGEGQMCTRPVPDFCTASGRKVQSTLGGKRQGRCSAARMLSMEPHDAAPTVQWPRDMFKGPGLSLESFALAARKVAQGLAGLVREAARLG